ncbi:MAG: hypothetical protein WC491_00075 [Candidatus Omnitrophota bacterium]
MRKAVFIAWLLVICSFISGCGPGKPEPVRTVPDNVSRDEYNLYRDVLDQEFQGKGDVVIKERTLIPVNSSEFGGVVRPQMIKEFGKQLNVSLIDAFVQANLKPAAINQDMLGYKTATVLTVDTEKEMFADVQIFYENFRAKYPNPSRMVEFSRVAFDYKMTRAIVYFGKIFYSGKSSSGSYLFMKKVKGKWVIDKSLAAWSL